MKSNKNKKRLFLALWPDDAIRQQLNRVLPDTGIQLLDGSPVRSDNLHMTLLFLGDVQNSDAQNLITSLDSVSFTPFTLSVNRWGHFHKPGILWLGVSDEPYELQQLYKQIKVIVIKHLNGVTSKSFKPHITLIRNAKTLPQVTDFEEIEWFVDSFALVESKLRSEGVEYTVLQQWDV